MSLPSVESNAFQKTLKRNFFLPLIGNILLCGTFIALVLNVISINQKVADANQVISRATRLLKVVIDAETGLRGFLLGGKSTFLEPFERAQKQFAPLVADLKVSVEGRRDATESLARFESKFNEWNRYARDGIARRRAGNFDPTRDSVDLRKTMMDEIRAEFQQVLDILEQIRDEWREVSIRRMQLMLVITVVLSLLIGGGLAIFGRRQLVNLNRTFSEAYDIQTSLNRSLQEQAWLRSGHTELGSQLRGELPVTEVANRMLDFLSRYVGALIGTVYVRRENDSLERVGSFAFSGEAPQRISFKEGLVGEVAQSGRLTLLNDVPSGYLRIASSLGEGAPRSLLIAPMVADETTQGVLELGFSVAPSEATLELLRQLSEMMGTAVRSAIYRTRLQELVMTTQQQSEELQAQQEELRVSNEELSERSRSLQEAQSRLESQHAELLQTNEQLEEQAQALEHQKKSLDDQNLALREARESVEDKARELIAANQYKSEFLANMSHELRTPLNSSLILAKLLKDNPQGNLTDEQVEFASTIYGAGNDLLVLINDILDLSKVEAGKLEIEPLRFAIHDVVEGLEKTFRPMAKERKLDLVLSVNSDVPPVMVSDRQRLEQILRNLLSNALKFTERGQVALTIARAGQGLLSFAVRDTGIGIPAHQRDVIFEAFRQADGTSNRKHGGTGLGLSISRNLSTLLGGTLTVESEPGQGSTFTLILPEQYREPMQETEITSVPVFVARPLPAPIEVSFPPVSEPVVHAVDDRAQLTPGARVLLVVEDEKPFAKILYELAHELGFRCLLAENTVEGYDLATRYLPSAVILDMKLPDALGLSLLDRLKENPKTRHIPVHAVSGADYSREALHLGAVGYAFKPADREELKKTLQTLEAKIRQEIKRVLVVEDDATQRSAIQKLIGEKGVEIVTSGSGAETLAALGASVFDCMILDLNLPDMTGFELLERLAQDERMRLMPVIVYTGRELSREEEDRLRRYSKTIIIKGARSPERLLDEVTLFLHQVESKLAPERQRLLSETRNREKAFEGRQILLVDDDVRNVFALTSALEQKGARVHIARNGRESLERLRSEEPIDIVLMDIMMPEMDGYTAIREIRKMPEHAKLPIIAVTAKAMRDDYEKCLEAGATDYLAKPIDVDKLVSLMRVWLPKQVGRG